MAYGHWYFSVFRTSLHPCYKEFVTLEVNSQARWDRQFLLPPDPAWQLLSPQAYLDSHGLWSSAGACVGNSPLEILIWKLWCGLQVKVAAGGLRGHKSTHRWLLRGTVQGVLWLVGESVWPLTNQMQLENGEGSFYPRGRPPSVTGRVPPPSAIGSFSFLSLPLMLRALPLNYDSQPSICSLSSVDSFSALWLRVTCAAAGPFHECMFPILT